MPLKQLQALKEIGDKTIKPYRDPVPPGCVIVLGHHVISYCIEDAAYQKQPTVAISRLDKQLVVLAETLRALPQLDEVFALKDCVAFREKAPMRGWMYKIVLNTKQEGSVK